MIDIKKIEEEARKEIMEELHDDVKDRYKDKLAEIEESRKVTLTLEEEAKIILAEASL